MFSLNKDVEKNKLISRFLFISEKNASKLRFQVFKKIQDVLALTKKERSVILYLL